MESKENKIYKGISYPESMYNRIKKAHLELDPLIGESTFVKKLIDEMLKIKKY